jgi:uncharacterized protein
LFTPLVSINEGMPMGHPKIDHVETSTSDVAASKGFVAKAFGRDVTDYGRGYRAFVGTRIDQGLDGSGQTPTGTSLVILKADDWEAAQAQVESAGVSPPFSIIGLPGGRLFRNSA